MPTTESPDPWRGAHMDLQTIEAGSDCLRSRPRHPGAGGRRLELSRLAPHEHDGMNDRGRDLKVDIHDLDRLSRSELRVLWTQELGERSPATLGRDVLALGIAYTRQERRHGGLSNPIAKELARLFDQVLRGDRTETP